MICSELEHLVGECLLAFLHLDLHGTSTPRAQMFKVLEGGEGGVGETGRGLVGFFFLNPRKGGGSPKGGGVCGEFGGRGGAKYFF